MEARGQSHLECHPPFLIIFFVCFEARSLTGLEFTKYARLPAWRVPGTHPPFPPPHCWDSKHMQCDFHIGSRLSNSGLEQQALQDFLKDIHCVCGHCPEHRTNKGLCGKESEQGDTHSGRWYMAVAANMALSCGLSDTLIQQKPQENFCSHPLRSLQWESSDGER